LTPESTPTEPTQTTPLIPGLSVEIHAPEEALVEEVIAPFAKAYELDAETEKIVTDSLQYREINGVNGKNTWSLLLLCRKTKFLKKA
jgi:hypothetical protein